MTIDKDKLDPVLGKQINDHLLKLGVETPKAVKSYLKPYNTDINMCVLVHTIEEQEELIKNYFSNIMTVLGLDINNDSLSKTPERVARMFTRELFWGLDYNNFPKCTTVENKMKYDEMVVEKNITVMSMCEHHWTPIEGTATIAYIPKNKIIGLSKLNRITDFFSRRPQIQERLTEQIFHTLKYILDTDNIAVLIEADHYCIKSRGVQDKNSNTVTSKLYGLFKTDARARAEFMSLAHRKSLWG